MKAHMIRWLNRLLEAYARCDSDHADRIIVMNDVGGWVIEPDRTGLSTNAEHPRDGEKGEKGLSDCKAGETFPVLFP